jgi:hypothetical protein
MGPSLKSNLAHVAKMVSVNLKIESVELGKLLIAFLITVEKQNFLVMSVIFYQVLSQFLSVISHYNISKN